MPDTDITRVIFRKFYKKNDDAFNEGEIIALFPDEKQHSPGMVMSYMHFGQHGAADIEGIMKITRPAEPPEYANLKRELERPPFEYKFKVLQRRPH